jgi:hypothetical protein
VTDLHPKVDLLDADIGLILYIGSEDVAFSRDLRKFEHAIARIKRNQSVVPFWDWLWRAEETYHSGDRLLRS